jgi:hypothetical protein
MGFRPRAIRRIITRVIVFLLLGAIVNVAVAWMCVRFPVLVSSTERLSTDSDLAMLRIAGWTPPDQPGGGVATTIYLGSSIRWRLHRQQRDATSTLEYLGADVSVGWPFHSLAGVTFDRFAFAGQPGPAPPTHFWMIGRLGDEWRLPLRPVSAGFAINTLFYAGILWLLFAAPFALRRRGRIKRRLCPACAYPIGSSAVCTECGKPVTPGQMPA